MLFLQLTARSLPYLEEDDRILPILRSFNQNAVSTSYDPNQNAGKVSVQDLDDVSCVCRLSKLKTFFSAAKSFDKFLIKIH